VGWARTYLKKAGLVSSTGRGRFRITDEGLRLLSEKPASIDARLLERYPAFVEFKQSRRSSDELGQIDAALGSIREIALPSDQTPEEQIDTAYKDLRAALADELLDRVRGCSPQLFERLVVELLVAMGYGGSLADAGKAVGRTGDDGIDGIIKEDKLGLDVVCIQAKRCENTVGRPTVQAFAGSMEGHRAKKGVLLTTATFSKDDYEYITRIERKIVLIDGRQLAELMIDHGIGTTISRSYEVRRIDSDYFFEDGSE
jgi:restriction system protein